MRTDGSPGSRSPERPRRDAIPDGRHTVDRTARLADVDAPEPLLRLAVPAEAPEIDALMKASTRDLFPAFYDRRQTASSVQYIAHVDRMLIEDGTYFVIEVERGLVACGGWSRRDKLFTGSAEQEGLVRMLDPATEPARVRAMFTHADWTRRGLGTRILEACEEAALREGFRVLVLMATLPGVSLYERFGFRIMDRKLITLPDGVELPGAAMEKRLGTDRRSRRAAVSAIGRLVSGGKPFGSLPAEALPARRRRRSTRVDLEAVADPGFRSAAMRAVPDPRKGS
jgi:GNAT superfamily N-acetyltransferase